MKYKHFKYIIFASFAVYAFRVITDINTFYYYPNQTLNIWLLISFFCLMLLYWLFKPYFKLGYNKINKWDNAIPLEYNIIYDPTNNSMSKIYVRKNTLLGFFWYELDYPYTLAQGCTLNKAKFFAKKFDTVEKLKGWVNKKYIQEKNQTIASQDNVEYWLLFIGMVSLFGIYGLIFGLINYYR